MSFEELQNSVRLVVGRSGSRFPRRVRPKDRKVDVHSFPAWRTALKGLCCGEQAGKFACCDLGQGI